MARKLYYTPQDATPLHRCGHPATIKRMCQSVPEKIATTVCDECFSRFAPQNEQAARECTAMGLPPLKGSERQIAWANSIRLQMIDRLQNIILHGGDSFENRRLLLEWNRQESAAWWIQNRG